MSDPAASSADRHSRDAALALSLALPADVVLYLLLPAHAGHFGVSLAQAGVLLAANRLIRIAGYGWVARRYAARGDRDICTLAALASAGCALSYALLSGFWLLLAARLLWGLSFAALNLSTQALATASLSGAAQRTGRSRALIATGPMLALPAAAWLAEVAGPRFIFFILAALALLALPLARRLPAHGRTQAAPPPARRIRPPGSLDAWSFMEGLTLDGLFIIGLALLAQDALPEWALLAAGVLMALRYLSEILLSPLGGRLADRLGAERMLVVLSLATSAALVGFGAGWLWACAFIIVVLRALQLPLLAPIVARRHPGHERIQALAARSIWRDIGAGAGPMLAGLLLPAAPPILIYGGAALLLSAAALACLRSD
ncbi:MAG: MFS transporter [Alcaligenaceae bacterium]|nr:MFS transporter [Alcaligenaceae bacterium SAGV5]MPS51959.1 MFS transporter [Alcaligenaceae bacterium SAGV3]MPT58394.1 MFS transporter [Alcaligenaceae bacterium]